MNLRKSYRPLNVIANSVSVYYNICHGYVGPGILALQDFRRSRPSQPQENGVVGERSIHGRPRSNGTTPVGEKPKITL